MSVALSTKGSVVLVIERIELRREVFFSIGFEGNSAKIKIIIQNSKLLTYFDVYELVYKKILCDVMSTLFPLEGIGTAKLPPNIIYNYFK